jgi:hypothetical protein
MDIDDLEQAQVRQRPDSDTDRAADIMPVSPALPTGTAPCPASCYPITGAGADTRTVSRAARLCATPMTLYPISRWSTIVSDLSIQCCVMNKMPDAKSTTAI